MDWDKLKTFYYVAKAGSFTHAVGTLNLSQSAISRQILQLEDRLGAQIFQRHPRGLILTKQGEILFQTVRRMLSEIELTKTLIKEEEGQLKGVLKIATSNALANIWLINFVPGFLERYPNIRLCIIGNDNEMDLKVGEADAAIQRYIPHQPDLIQRFLLSCHLKLYASQGYLDKFGVPETPEDLDHHHLLTFGEDIRRPNKNINWMLKLGVKPGYVREPYLRINSALGLRRAAEAGLGIAALSKECEPQEITLVNVLPKNEGPVVDLRYVYPDQLKNSRRVLAFGDYLAEVLSSSPKENIT
jgi:DNA-binding transcriptional LysR family regulator